METFHPVNIFPDCLIVHDVHSFMLLSTTTYDRRRNRGIGETFYLTHTRNNSVFNNNNVLFQDSVGLEMANSKYSVPIKKIAMSGLVVTVHMQNWGPQIT